jgi:hypothetical protein
MTVSKRRWDKTWQSRLSSDRNLIGNLLPQNLRGVHSEVVKRAEKANADGLLLTGSTARGTRTQISDLDYHLVGDSIDSRDLPEELDIHVVSAETFQRRLLDGDDFTQWSLRFGLVVFDEGALKEAVWLIEAQDLWPDADRKRRQSEKSLSIARAMVESGDLDAAIEQVRTALTLTARWRLLESGQFPLSRGELAAQLQTVGLGDLGASLAATIHGAPTLIELMRSVEFGQTLLEHPVSPPDRSLAHR